MTSEIGLEPPRFWEGNELLCSRRCRWSASCARATATTSATCKAPGCGNLGILAARLREQARCGPHNTAVATDRDSTAAFIARPPHPVCYFSMHEGYASRQTAPFVGCALQMPNGSPDHTASSLWLRPRSVSPAIPFESKAASHYILLRDAMIRLHGARC